MPIGADLAWATDGKPVEWYRDALKQFGANRLNWTRIWMCHWGRMNLDWLAGDTGPSPSPGQLDARIAANWDAVVVAAEAKAEKILPVGTRENNEAHKFLKSVHGLLAMLQTPALNVILAGVEDHPEATLGELLAFMGAYNLRFGQAKTPGQQRAYDTLYPMLVDLREEVAPALANSLPSKADPAAVGEFFSAMSYDDLRKKAPAPPRPVNGQ